MSTLFRVDSNLPWRRHDGVCLPSNRWAKFAVIGAAVAFLFNPRKAAAATAATPGNLRGYATLEAEVPSSSGPLDGAVTGPLFGFQLDAGAGPRSLPVLFGLGMGVTTLGDVRYAFPMTESGVEQADIRHLDLSLRLEPDLPYLRPFAAVSVGVAALYLSQPSSPNADDDLLQDVSMTRSVSVGVDIAPWGRPRSGAASVMITLGYRFTDDRPLHFSSTYAADAVLPLGGSLQMRGPFVGITFFAWS